MSNSIKANLESLNDEQREAVCAEPGRHYLVLAGAGCGKTTVLTERIAYRAACGTPLSRILALTFTRKAADEMAERVARRTAGGGGLESPLITTFHAFALRILGERYDGVTNFSRLGFAAAPQCLSEEQRLALLARSSTPEERTLLGTDIIGLDAATERVNVFPRWIDRFSPEQAALLLDIGSRFRAIKRSEGWWDFSDLIDSVVSLFETSPGVGEYVRERFAEVLVDEFQDTNPVQIRLLRLLLGGARHLFAVGDDDQAIYGFRGADIGPTLSFTTEFPGARIIKLQTNYRSVPAILAKANRIFRFKDSAYRKVLVSGRYPARFGTTPSLHRFDDQERMALWILSMAQKCSSSLNVPIDRMAALFRINQTARWMDGYFVNQGIAPASRPQLLTVHKSKGLEFPVVFVCDLEESVFPSYREPRQRRIRSFGELIGYLFKNHRTKIACDWDEEERLFYVAVTRAQQRLFLLTTLSKQVYGRKRRFKPSRFLRLIR